jgi:protein involved in polysaccharide export with SLBB domain
MTMRKTVFIALMCVLWATGFASAEGPAAASIAVAAPAAVGAPAAIGVSGVPVAVTAPGPGAIGAPATSGISGASALAPLAPAAAGTAGGTAPQAGLPPVLGEKGASPLPLGEVTPPAQAKEGTLPSSKDGKAAADAQGLAGSVEMAEMSAAEKLMSASEDGGGMRPQPFRVGRLSQFGYSFFKKSTAFAPVVDVPVGAEYVIGPGDTLVLTAWGSLDGTFPLEVNRSGEVTLPKVGAVRVWGVPFGKVTELLRATLSQAFRNVQLNVTMGKLRLIKVYLVGEVDAPGDYNVSSLSTVINALAAAGGPSKNGSLRAIQVIRAGKVVETIDLYDFFLKGDKSRDIRLQPGDTINVPIHGNLVGIGGNVRKPAIYEFPGETSLKELLDMAGGVPPSSYLQRIQLSRVTANDKKLVEDFNFDPKLSSKEFEARAAGIKLKDMDLVKIMPIDLTVRDQVRLDGYVLRPGGYALKPGMRVKDLVGTDNLLPEYYPDTVEITRLMPPDFHPEKMYVNLDRAMQGQEKDNILLTEFDAVRIYSRFEMEEMPYVTISGEVIRPGTYRLNKNERVVDLVKEGGNLKRKGYARKVEIRRLRYGTDLIVPYSIYIDLEEAFKGNPNQNILLEPFDEVIVKKWDYDDTRVVRISGEVHRPGEYRLVDGMTITDLVMEAGNIKKSAFLKNAEIVRLKITGSSVTSYPIAVSLEDALKGSPEANIPLQDQDEVMIRRLPQWMDETDRYVILRGEVQFPGTYPIFKGEKLSSVLRRAGGYTDKAYQKGAKFTRRSVQALQQKRMDDVIARTEQDLARKQQELASVAASKEELQATKTTLDGMKASLDKLKTTKAEGRISLRLGTVEELNGSPYDVELQGGDVLEVPPSTNSVLVFGEVYNPTTIVNIPGEDLEYYLKKAGGATVNADKDEMYVIRADGTVESRREKSSFFHDGFMAMSLDPGDTVVVPQLIEKVAWMRDLKDIAFIIGQTALAAGVLVAAGL